MTPSSTIPPLVCPPDGLPPLGVDRGRNRLEVIVAVLLGGALGYLTIHAGRDVLAFDLLFLVGWFAATALHEIGHAAAGYARGFRIVAIFVGPVTVRRSAADGLRLGLRRVPLGGKVFGGPRRWDGDARFRTDYAWFVGGGSVVSIAVGVIGWLASRSFSVAWEWSVISIVLGAVTLIPSRYASGRTSDGEKLLRLRHAGPTETSLMALQMMMLTVPPRDWDPALIAIARGESESQGRDAIDATLLLYYHALDSGDAPGAGALLQRLIDYTCGTARWPRTTVSAQVAIEAAMFEAAWRDDLAAAQEWLARVPRRTSKPATLIADAIARFRRAASPWHRATLKRFASAASSSSSS